MVEACASKELVSRLEAAVTQCAPQQAVTLLDDALKAAQAELGNTSAALGELRDTAAPKQALAQRGKEIEALRARLDEKLGRDECAGMLASKLDKAEARGLLQQQEQLSSQVVGAEAHARRLQDSLSTTNNAALDAHAQTKQLALRMDRISGMTSDIDGRLNQRKNELSSLTKVVRLMLDDAEMRCAIDEAEGATAAEATDVLSRLRGVKAGHAGAPMTISGVTLHKPAGGHLTPMPPGAAAADKVRPPTRLSPAALCHVPMPPPSLRSASLTTVSPCVPASVQVWYKSNLQPRSDMLGARRRMLVNARHSWVGDACLARGGDEPSGAPALTPMPPGASRSGGDGMDCLLTPSSMSAPLEPIA